MVTRESIGALPSDVMGDDGGETMDTDDTEPNFTAEWGTNRLIVPVETLEVLRGWANSHKQDSSERAITGTTTQVDLVHLTATLSLLIEEEPDIDADARTKAICTIDSIDRVDRNEIPAVKLLLKERYDGQDILLAERLSAHVVRGTELLSSALDECEMESPTLLDMLTAQPEAEAMFAAVQGISPAQNTLEDFI